MNKEFKFMIGFLIGFLLVLLIIKIPDIIISILNNPIGAWNTYSYFIENSLIVKAFVGLFLLYMMILGYKYFELNKDKFSFKNVFRNILYFIICVNATILYLNNLFGFLN